MNRMRRIGYTFIFSLLFLSNSTMARTITVKNNITKKMTGYPVMLFRVYPSKFQISINGEPIKPGESKKVQLNSDKLKILHEYTFKQRPGKLGAKEITYSFPKNMNAAAITFNWKKKPKRILIKGANYVSTKEISSIPHQK